jgi:ketosteroid isomerase-like protein
MKKKKWQYCRALCENSLKGGTKMQIENQKDYEEFMAATNKTREVVEKAVDGINSGDAEGFISCFSDDFEFWMPGTTPVSGSTKGIAEFGALVSKVADYLDELIKIKVTNFIVNGEWAASEATGHGVTKKGKDYNNNYCHIWRVQDGKITRFVEYNDTDLIMRVLVS